MIPLALTLKNFMCYRDNVPTLHLEGIHVACLCGANGHGKSALLDAITWALWGESRAHSQDELVHQGQREMQVDLEFLAREARYRVSRRHRKAATSRQQGVTRLELQVASGDTSTTYRPIGGNTVRETEEKIRQLLSMDYHTFINSALLLQGRFDEFTRSTPRERKEVLAKVLNLAIYDRLEERAKEAAASRRQQAALLLDQAERLRQEVERRPFYEAELATVQPEMDQLQSNLDTQEQLARNARLAYDRLRQAQEELERLQPGLREAEEQMAELQPQVDAHQQRIQDYQSALGELEDRARVESTYARLRQARMRLEELGKKLAKASQLLQRKAEVERTIALARQQLQHEVEQLRLELDTRVIPLVQAHPALLEQLAQVRQRLAGLQEEDQELKEQRQRLLALGGEAQAVNSRKAQVEEEGRELRAKVDLLQRDHDVIRCPLCRTELGPEGRRHLATAYDEQIQERRSEYQRLAERLRALETERSQAEERLRGQERAGRERQTALQRQAAALEQQLPASEEASHRRGPLQEQLQGRTEALDRGQFAPAEALAQLGRLEEELQALGYDPSAHEEARQQVQNLEPAEEAYRRVQEAGQRLPEEQQAMRHAQALLQHWREGLDRDQARFQELEQQVANLPQAQTQVEQTEATLRRLAERQQELAGRRAVLEHSIRDSSAKDREETQVLAQWRSVQQEESVFQELAAALGKGGVQALLIEAAIPELEAEANQLLSRLTDARMALKLETQRERRSPAPSSGSPPIETLDIKVSDELGARNYELFSGGEAFRINFALRVALSRLLARRAGAPLSTLFIDEGFGTQDAQGREHLLEAIRAIQEDFQCIIVITHIEELKEAFPVRIEVTKGDAGSSFHIT